MYNSRRRELRPVIAHSPAGYVSGPRRVAAFIAQAKKDDEKHECAKTVDGLHADSKQTVQRLSENEADPLPLAIDTDWVFPWTTTWMLPLVLYWELKNVPA